MLNPVRDDTDLGAALMHGELAYLLEAQPLPDKNGFLRAWLKRVITTKAFSNSVLKVLREMRSQATPAVRFNRYLADYLRIRAGRLKHAHLTDKERLKLCFNDFRAWGALASFRLAGPGSVPVDAPLMAKDKGVFFISQSDYDSFINDAGSITKPLAMSYFCPLSVKAKAVDVLFSYGFGVAVPNVGSYRSSVLLISSSQTVQLNDRD